MLSDDITKATGAGINTVGRVIGSALRGAILFGLLAFGACALATALPAIVSFLGIGMGLGIATAAASVAGSIGCVGALILGAEAGAVLLGVTSLIPSASDWFGAKQLLRYSTSSPRPMVPSQTDLSPSQAPTTALENTAAKDNHAAAILAQRENLSQNAGLGL